MRHPAAAASLFAAALVSTTLAAAVTDRMSTVVPLAPGTPIRIDATIADVAITGSARTDMRVEVERSARTRADLAEFPVKVDARPDAVRIGIVQEPDRRDPASRASVRIDVPSDAVLQAVRVFEGHVRLANLSGACDVDLQRGVIDATHLSGRVRLESGLGGIDVRDAELTAGGMMRLRVFNGPVRVRFARAPVNGRILAVTLNGSVASDIPLTMKDRFGPRFGESTLGTGEPVLSADVVKGDIALTVGKP